MATIFVFTHYLVDAIQTISATNETAFQIQGSTDVTNPSLTNLGRIEVRSTNPNWGAYGVIMGSGGFFNGSFFRNAVGAVLDVAAVGANNEARGFSAGGWSADVLNDGLIKVASQGRATAIYTNDGDALVRNTGRIEVTAGSSATGVDLDVGGIFENTGVLAVVAGSSGGTGVSSGRDLVFTNSGSITVADSTAALDSVGLYFESFRDVQITNSGLIEADRAIVGAGFSIIPLEFRPKAFVLNTGVLKGALVLPNGSDRLENQGQIVGRIELGEGDDSYVGGAGSLTGELVGGAGADRLEGGAGQETSVYAGAASQYDWWQAADGWRVKDLRTGSPEGTDTLLSIERLRFSDRTVNILGLTSAEKLTDAYANILRSVATGSELTFLDGLIAAVNGGAKTLSAAVGEIVAKADQTTAVAALSYQFFLGFTPSKPGFDYLVSPQGPNANNINSAYYQSFNIENRYINFAVNLGKFGDGAAGFLAEYGGKTLFEATKSAYMEIFGGTVADAKITQILDTPVGAMSRAQYFAIYGGNDIGTKAAMVGWLLTEAAKADLGMYARSSNAFLTDLADGAQTLIDLVGTYGKSDYVFNG